MVTGAGAGAGMDAIALQPSKVARRLPAVGASRTIPRHAGPLGRTRVAGVRAPHPERTRRAPRPRSPHAVLRPPSDPAPPPRPETDAPAASAAVFTCPAPAAPAVLG